MGWKIKQTSGDFEVKEIICDRTRESWKDRIRQIHGKDAVKREKYIWFTLKKTDRDFFRSVEEIAKGLDISTKDIGYSGTKDKKAVTYQTMSVPSLNEEEIKSLESEGLEFSDFRKMNRHVRLGEHSGNEFTIIVRCADPAEEKKISKRIAGIRKDGMINYFGEQRFGSVDGRNHERGKQIITGEMRPSKAMPLRKAKLFVHAYQSLIWNRTAKKYGLKSSKNIEIPVVGYETNLEKHREVKDIIEGILRVEGIKPQDFRISGFPKLSSKGATRTFMVYPENLKYKFSTDEKNKGFRKIYLSFVLPKGSYATEMVRQLESGCKLNK